MLSFGGWASAQQYTTGRRKDTTLSSRLAAAAIELQLITEHAGPAIRRPEKRHVSSLLREKRQETEYTSACTRILAKGTQQHLAHRRTERISEIRSRFFKNNILWSRFAVLPR